MVMILGAFGGQELEAWIRIRYRRKMQDSSRLIRRSRIVRLVILEGIVLAMIPILVFWAPLFAQTVADIKMMHVEIGNLLARETNVDDVIALNDIGAIGYISDREVIDLMGLISPDAIEFVEGVKPGEWDDGLAIFINEKQPAYLVVFPNWFPKMIGLLPTEQVYSISLPERTIAGLPGLAGVGGGEMVVYRLNWPESEFP